MRRLNLLTIFSDSSQIAAAAMLGIAAGAGWFVLASKHVPTLSMGFILGAATLLGAAIGLGKWALKPLSPRHHFRFLWSVLFGSLVLRFAGLAIYAPGYPQLADRQFFMDFIDNWVRGGWQGEGLAPLSTLHDFQLWASRGWPQHLAFRLFSPNHHVLYTQVLNALLGVLLLGIAYGLARQVMNRRRSRFALALAALSPAHLWMTLDYTYQYQGAVLFSLVIWLLATWVRNPARVRLPHGLWLGLLLIGLHLQQGINWLAMAAACIPPLLWLMQGQWTWSLRHVLKVLLPAFLLAIVVPMPFDRWVERHDHHRVYSHVIAQMGIGFNPETGGEFYGPYVVMDRSTPAEEKNQTAFRLVLSHVRYHPIQATVQLPLIKLIKFFQLGAATGVEEALQQAGRTASRDFFRGGRVVYTPALLGLAAMGLLGLRRRHPDPTTMFACILLGFGLVYGFITQTSPRYSFILLPLLTTLAAQTPTWPTLRQMARQGTLPRPGTAILILGLWGLYAGLGLGAAQLVPDSLLFQDARQMEVAGAGWTRTEIRDTLAPFVVEAQTRLTPVTPLVLHLGEMPGPGQLSFYVFQGHPRDLRFQQDGQWLSEEDVQIHAQRVAVRLPAAGQVSVWLDEGAARPDASSTISMGYFGFEPARQAR